MDKPRLPLWLLVRGLISESVQLLIMKFQAIKKGLDWHLNPLEYGAAMGIEPVPANYKLRCLGCFYVYIVFFAQHCMMNHN
jgi:hypothetical protein